MPSVFFASDISSRRHPDKQRRDVRVTRGTLAASQLDRLEREIAATDAEIDNLVYELYGATEQERRIVEGSSWRKDIISDTWLANGKGSRRNQAR